MKRFRSDRGSAGIRYRTATGLALLFALAPLGASIAPSVVTTDLFIVSEDEPIAEDVYVAATSGRVEGRIDGDLVISTGSLSISGTVAGDVLALTSGTVRIEREGVVEGSLRAVSPRVVVEGDVRKDFFATGIAAKRLPVQNRRLARTIYERGAGFLTCGDAGSKRVATSSKCRN